MIDAVNTGSVCCLDWRENCLVAWSSALVVHMVWLPSNGCLFRVCFGRCIVFELQFHCRGSLDGSFIADIACACLFRQAAELLVAAGLQSLVA
jgi:hypothetical protein